MRQLDITLEELLKLPDYSFWEPTGQYPGKVWRRQIGPGGAFGPEGEKIPPGTWIINQFVWDDFPILRVINRGPVELFEKIKFDLLTGEPEPVKGLDFTYSRGSMAIDHWVARIRCGGHGPTQYGSCCLQRWLGIGFWAPPKGLQFGMRWL